MAMRRAFSLLICSAAVLLVGGCGSAKTGRSVDYAAKVVVDSRGWLVDVPHGWHVIRFRDAQGGVSSAGLLISNVRLPRPTVEPGYPIQVNNNVLPPHGIGLVIATDTDPQLERSAPTRPPLPGPEKWLHGSASPGEPYMESVWFLTKGSPVHS
jgi:hypothetical protein